MALFSKILIFYVIGVNISFVIIWFISHEKTHIRLLSAFLVGITWPMSLPVGMLVRRCCNAVLRLEKFEGSAEISVLSRITRDM